MFMIEIKKLKDLKVNGIYHCTNTQFNVSYNVRCLGGYGHVSSDKKVYLTRENSKETPRTMKRNFESNRLIDGFVLWDSALGSDYILRKIQ